MSDNDLKLQIALRGDMTKEYVDLHALGIALINIQTIFDRSYCFYTGRKRITSLGVSVLPLMIEKASKSLHIM